MHRLSENLNYEKAAFYRDKIRSLEKINKSNDKESKNLASADFFCLSKINNMYAVEIVFLETVETLVLILITHMFIKKKTINHY